MPVLHLTRGLKTSLVKASPEHCVDALNCFDRNGDLISRLGMVPHSDPDYTTGSNPHGAGFGDSDAHAHIETAGESVALADDIYWYVCGSTAFNRVAITGITSSASSLQRTMTDGLTVKYWDGSAWATCNAKINHATNYDSSNDTFSPAPFTQNGAAGPPVSGHICIIVMDPPDDWTSRTLGGVTGYYLRVEGYVVDELTDSTFDITAASSDGGVSVIQTVENRTLHINTWLDRAGARHELVVRWLVGASDARWWLDDVELTIGDSLSFGTGALWNEQTRVDSFYHPATDKLIGRVTGVGWFYLTPSQSRVDLFTADDQPGRPYQSLPEGLRSAIPPGNVCTMFDGRLWAFDGLQATWSAPDVFPDVWPNQFEQFLQEGEGPVTAAVAFKSFMAVFCTTAVFRVTPTGGDGYLFEKMTGDIGCIGPRAACVIGDYAAFLSGDGVYTFDGTTVECISRAIDELFHDSPVTGRREDAWLLFHQPYNHLRLFYPSLHEVSVYDAAFYADADGYVSRVSGESVNELAWWPQGKYARTDYGFNASCFHVDLTGAVPVMLLGDRYGVVWQMDMGAYDGGSPVYSKAQGIPVNVDTSQQVIVTRVDVSLRNNGDQAITIRVVPDQRSDEAEDYDDSVYVAASLELVDATTVVDSTSLVLDNDGIILMECPFATRCRAFSVGFVHEEAGQVQFLGFDVKVNRAGNRGERGQ